MTDQTARPHRHEPRNHEPRQHEPRPLAEIVAPDWAEALAPVEDQVHQMGRFLREELAAGRSYLPAGERVLRAFSRPLADVRVLVVGQDPYPPPGMQWG